MSKYSGFRSFSPPHISREHSDSNLYERHRALIHHEVSQLPNSPRSKQRIEQNFEEMLKSIHFFRKPDIIPSPYLTFDPNSEEKTRTIDQDSKNLAFELEKERKLRKSLEKDNENLKSRLIYLTDIEKQYEGSRSQVFRIKEQQGEIDKLRTQVEILLDENEELRRKLQRNQEFSLSQSRLQQELCKEGDRNVELLKQLKDFKDEYEDMRRAYAKDINTQKERYERLYDEKIQLEMRLRELRGIEERQNFKTQNEDSIQERIKIMKNEYRAKLTKLEKRFDDEKPDDLSDWRLREIEERLGNLQEKLAEQSAVNEKILRAKWENAPFLDKSPERIQNFSPAGTWQSSSLSKSPVRDGRVSKQSGKSNSEHSDRPEPAKSPNRLARSNNNRSPNKAGLKSPDSRTHSRHRLDQQHSECETCVKRHRHEWAKSPT